MARYAATVTAPGSADEALGYLADFSSSAEWDPGVTGRGPDRGPAAGRGALPRGDELHRPAGRVGVRSVELEVPHRAVLRAETRTVVSLDTITVRELPGSGSEVTYDAELSRRERCGSLTPCEHAFKRVGDRAKAGLADALARRGRR